MITTRRYLHRHRAHFTVVGSKYNGKDPIVIVGSEIGERTLGAADIAQFKTGDRLAKREGQDADLVRLELAGAAGHAHRGRLRVCRCWCWCGCATAATAAAGKQG